jgi:hypothetical protein
MWEGPDFMLRYASESIDLLTEKKKKKKKTILGAAYSKPKGLARPTGVFPGVQINPVPSVKRSKKAMKGLWPAGHDRIQQVTRLSHK